MAILTPLSLDEARPLGGLFGVGIETVTPLKAGSVNSNFRARTDSGTELFLRIYEEQTLATANREAALVRCLDEAGVRTPLPLVREDGRGTIAEHRGKPVAIMPWIEGDMICQKGVTPTHAAAIGESLAAIHDSTAAVLDTLGSATLPEDRFGPERIAARIAELRNRGVNETIESALNRAEAVVSGAYEGRAGPPVIIHGDLFRDNVLWSGGAISALLDFESASMGRPLFDLAVAVHAWCFGDDFVDELAVSLLRGYARRRPFDQAAPAALLHELRTSGARFLVTRISDFELRPAGSGVFKDYRRFAQRLDAIEQRGERGIASWFQAAPMPPMR